MQLVKDLRYLITSCCLHVLFCDAFLTLKYNFIKDRICHQFNELSKYLNVLDTSQVADLQCARRCAHVKDCDYFRTVSYRNGSKQCEIFSIKGESPAVIGQDQSQSIHYFAALTENGLAISCFRSPNATLPTFSIEIEVQSQKRLAYIDSTKPETQKKRYMSDNRRKHNVMETTAVYMDASGVYHALVINHLSFKNDVYKGVMVYGMEKSVEAFNESAARELYSLTFQGTLFVSSIWPNGESRITETSVPEFRIYVPAMSEFSLVAKHGKTRVNDLTSWIRQGFKIFSFKYVTIFQHKSSVIFYRPNQNLKILADGEPVMPLSFRQMFQVFNGKLHRCLNVLGSAHNISGFKLYAEQDIALSPLWRSPFGPSVGIDQRKSILKSQMLEGHQFRLSHKDSYFDVDQVINYGEEIYFLLPQQFNESIKKFSVETTGRRAVASFMGKYFWCSHYLEGDEPLDYGIELDQTFQYFVDTKKWLPLFSVDSNGNVASGNVADLAEAAVEGKDLNVLIQWLTNGRLKLMPITMTSVDGYGTSEVLITAESVVSWNLIETLDGEMEFNPSCDMEKVLVKSNGEVQVLVYNTHKREPVDHLTDLQITWFAF